MQNCTPHTTHMLDIHMYRAGHAANVILAEHTGGKNLTFPQMWTAHMGQSCSSSPSVQYWSQLLLKSEQTIWITPEAEWLKALKSTLALDTQVYPAASPQTSWVSLATSTKTYKNLRFAAPLRLMALVFLAITHTYIHSTFTLPSLNNSLQ